MMMCKHVFVLLLLQAAKAEEQPDCDSLSTCAQPDATADSTTGDVLLQTSRLIHKSSLGLERTVLDEEEEPHVDEGYDATLLQEQEEEETNIEEQGWEIEEETDAEDWSDFNDPIMYEEEDEENGGRVSHTEVYDEKDKGPVVEGGDGDSLEKFVSMEEAKQALLERASAESNAKLLEAFREQLDFEVKDATGAEGSMVVGLLDKVACPEKHYIYHTFVHFDQKAATLACRPCHNECLGLCYGPSLEECAELEHVGMTQTAAQSGAAASTSLVASLEQSFRSLLENLTETSYDDLVENQSAIPIQTNIPGIEQCLANATCTVRSTYLGTIAGTAREDETVADLLFSTSLKYNETGVDAYADLSKFQRAAIDKETEAAGFVPGMFKVPDNIGNNTDDPLAPANEDYKEGVEGKFLEDGVEGNSSLAQMADEISAGDREHSWSKMSWSTRYRLKKKGKDWVKWQAKKHAKDYAKSEISAWLGTKKNGYCTAAMDNLIGTTQSVYGCFKEHYGTLQKAMCDPPAQYRAVKENVDTAVSLMTTLKTVTHPLQYVPYVGPVSKQLYRVSKLFLKKANPVQKQLAKHHTQPYGGHEDAQCCPPFQTSKHHCKQHPGWKYRCGGCQAGTMCHAQRACNSLIKLEGKIDKWKEKYYDPVIERLAEAAGLADHKLESGPLTVNSLLQKCGVPNCMDAEKFAIGVKKAVAEKFTDKICPISTPTLKMPDLGLINTVLGFMNKIAGVFRAVQLALNKLHCISVPRIQFWTETECTRIDLPCCSCCHSRRRWIPVPHCGWCSHNVCVPVPKSRAWMERICFSAMHIIRYISGVLQTLFAPIIYIVETAINALLAPIMSLIGKLIDQFFAPLNAFNHLKFPNLRLMEIDLPKLPTPFVNVASIPKPTCDWVKQMIRNGR